MRILITIVSLALFAAPQAMAQDTDSKPAKTEQSEKVAEEVPSPTNAPEVGKQPTEAPSKSKQIEKPRRAPTGQGAAPSHGGAKNSNDDGGERFPHGSSWNGDVYGASGWWASLHIGGGLSLMQTNEGIAASGSQLAQGFYLGSTLHASHLWGLTLDLALSSVTVTGDGLQSGWTEYTAQNLLVTFGGKLYPWTHEVFSVAIGAHVGFNQYDSSVVGDAGTGSWGGPELAFGGVIELSYYPMHALEIGVNVRVDSLMGGDNSAENEWQGTGAPDNPRLLIGANLLLGFHF